MVFSQGKGAISTQGEEGHLLAKERNGFGGGQIETKGQRQRVGTGAA